VGVAFRNVHQDAILVVEDEDDIRALIAEVLVHAGYVVREVRSGEEAIEAVRHQQPLLVMLDVRLSGISGYEVCGWLRSRFHDSLPIMFLSGERMEAFDRAAGLMLGADDYLLKPFSTEELLARVRGLLRRTVPSPRSLEAKLTVRELEVLRLLAGGLGQKEISGRLGISVKTVGTHIEHILMKLGVQSRTQAVALAYRERLIDGSSAGTEAEQDTPKETAKPRR
jgi:two-component system nitrate/nitrite response regulator NarL